MRISDWSSDVCSSDLRDRHAGRAQAADRRALRLAEGEERPRQQHRDGSRPRHRGHPIRRQILQVIRRQRPETRGQCRPTLEIGGDPWWERVCKYVEISVGAVALKTKKIKRNQK